MTDKEFLREVIKNEPGEFVKFMDEVHLNAVALEESSGVDNMLLQLLNKILMYQRLMFVFEAEKWERKQCLK